MKQVFALAAALAIAPMALAQTTSPAPRLAPHAMSHAALEAEVLAARPLLLNGGVHSQMGPGCSAPENHQLDFWIGEWVVSPANSDMLVAQSTIRPLDQGCSILEEWRPFASGGGHSISSYDSADQTWHQEWMDASGARTHFQGAFDNGTMRLNNLAAPPPGAPANLRRRMNYRQIDANTVRQWGERFNETTQQWDETWVFVYHRRAGTRP
jgi:hypothetical protein